MDHRQHLSDVHHANAQGTEQEQKSPPAQQSREESREKISVIASSLNCHRGKKLGLDTARKETFFTTETETKLPTEETQQHRGLYPVFSVVPGYLVPGYCGCALTYLHAKI
eukprot:2844363-Rhodomonas_salina.3